VQGVAPSFARSETYIEVTTKGRCTLALLDTGCERSVCPLRFCRNAKLLPVQTELFAANGTRIPVMGATCVYFQVEGVAMQADVFVSEAVDEFILDYDFLCNNNCEWLFAQGRIVINGMSVRLRARAPKPSVRRIYVREPVCIPSDASANVPVRLPFVNMHTPQSNWLTESKQIRPGLLALELFSLTMMNLPRLGL